MVVLDSSALLALLLNETGSEVVAPLTRVAELSIINYCEVLTKVAEAGGEVEEADRIILSYGIRVRAFREGHAMEAARMRASTMHLGLSLGDRACLAQGKFSELPVLTTDRRMAEADVGVAIRLIR